MTSAFLNFGEIVFVVFVGGAVPAGLRDGLGTLIADFDPGFSPVFE